ncbi:hypothetical protein M758_1G272900 [Ceratodon purpureus]|nr:hypothetical protein M758_1G272900 [Ceratodon purpureus]
MTNSKQTTIPTKDCTPPITIPSENSHILGDHQNMVAQTFCSFCSSSNSKTKLGLLHRNEGILSGSHMRMSMLCLFSQCL